MPVVIITRPLEDAQTLATLLSKHGFASIIDPMLSIHMMNENAAALQQALHKDPQAILVASRHAVRSMAQMSPVRHIPVIAVGQATADCARDLDFDIVQLAGGSSQALITHTLTHCAPERGPLIYARGVDVTMDIALPLSQASFVVESIILYHARAAQQFSAQLSSAIEEGSADGAVFFSQHTASAYVKLAQHSDLAKHHKNMKAACMSEAIAAKLRALPWGQIEVAAEPDLQNTIDAVIRVFK